MKARQPLERTIASNYYDDLVWETTKLALIKKYEALGIEKDVTDMDIIEELSVFENVELRDFKAMMSFYLTNHTMILTCSVGRWDGIYDGGKVIQTLDDLMSFFEDCDNYKIYDCNGHLYLQGSHHDGTNYAEVKTLNKKGIDFLFNHEYDYEESRLCNSLFNYYSVLPNLAHVWYGSPKREYEAAK